MSLVDERTHIAEEEGKQNTANVHTVLVGIGKNDDFVIIDFIEFEVGIDARADGADHRTDLLVFQNLRKLFLLYVQRLAAQGQNGLILSHSRLLCRTACGIPLYDEHFVEFGFSARASRELADERQAVNAVFRPCVVLRRFCRNTGLRRALRLFDNFVHGLFITADVFEGVESFHDRRFHRRTRLGVAELGLRLSFKLHVRHLDRKDDGKPFTEIVPLEVGILLFQKSVRSRIFIEHAGQPRTETHFVISPFGRGNIIDEREHTFPIFPRMLNGEFHLNVVLGRLIINGLRVQLVLVLVEALDVIGDPPFVFEMDTIRFAFERKLVQLAEE